MHPGVHDQPKPFKSTKRRADAAAASDLRLSADSEDDLPLIKMVKTSLSDAELKETLQTLLRDADLEEMTMKKICQKVGGGPEPARGSEADQNLPVVLSGLTGLLVFQVFDMFPEHDLSSRKDFIKQTVKDVSDHTHARAHAHNDAHNAWFYFESSLEEQDVMICVKQVLVLTSCLFPSRSSHEDAEDPPSLPRWSYFSAFFT